MLNEKSEEFKIENKAFDVIAFIAKKRWKKAYTEVELTTFINLVNQQKIPDYQVTAWLMAVAINGMNDLETYYLTKAMVNSGTTYKLNNYDRILVDKHSTGGIGDKISLILLPILVAAGLSVAKISGRGLGYTGGTIDKLEAIKINTQVDYKEVNKLLKKTHMFVMQQTEDLVPVDKIFYALRDVTATTQSIPLIASSIMSKKIALNTDYIFIDIKYGSGSFCETIQDAKKLANALKEIANHFNRKLTIFLSTMQQPLGQAIGNSIELVEAYQFLSGTKVTKDLATVVESFVVNILLVTKIVNNKEEALKKYNEIVSSKKGLQVLNEWFQAQNADMMAWRHQTFFNPKHTLKIHAPKAGFFNIKSAAKIGEICNLLGAGRMCKDDKIDYDAGIWMHKKINDIVKEGDLLYSIFSSKPIPETISANLLKNTEFLEQKAIINRLVLNYE